MPIFCAKFVAFIEYFLNGTPYHYPLLDKLRSKNRSSVSKILNKKVIPPFKNCKILIWTQILRYSLLNFHFLRVCKIDHLLFTILKELKKILPLKNRFWTPLILLIARSIRENKILIGILLKKKYIKKWVSHYIILIQYNINFCTLFWIFEFLLYHPTSPYKQIIFLSSKNV